MINLDLKNEALQILKDLQEITVAAIETGKNTAIAGINSAEEVKGRLKDFGFDALRDTLQSMDSLTRMTAHMMRKSIKDGIIGLVETAEEINSALKGKGPVSPK
ncbi:TPA: hypothetical protein ENG04_12620 [Candidatus Poribacteria bacterium]|nr:hypothetical protein [Candidatus Poribacteria bacterium]HEX30915.1 hypothetical protein [Candidatus Poribacteria bacterium]